MINSHKVKTRMYELGLTQDDIAKGLSMDISTFNLKLNNNRRFYVNEIAGLSKLLGITTQEELSEYFGLDFLTISSTCEKAKADNLGGV